MNLAMKAVSLDQKSQHAWIILAWAHLMSHNKDKALNTMVNCLSINPNNTMYRDLVGFGFVCSGEYEKGWELLTKAIQSPYYFWAVKLGLCFYHLKQHDFEEAYFWARLIKRSGFIWDPLLRLCCNGHLNDRDDMSAVKDELMGAMPDFGKKAQKLVAVFILDKELVTIIIKGLQQAGLDLN
jgi:tetratricopeptide (TPR) repeat protein